MLRLADNVGLFASAQITGHKFVSGFGTEMRHVHDGGGIIGQHRKSVAWRQRLQPLARLEHWQGAQKPRRVEKIDIVTHTSQIEAMFHPVHKVVTACRGDAALQMG